jgi:hypothetical protein
MSLVISAWNKSVGIALCEGRVGAWIDGKYVPTEEDHSKLTRLPNDGILGIAGHSRKGFPAYASLLDVCAGHLRPAIVQAAQSMGFRELSQIIPALLAECNKICPELFFCVSLLGTDNGTVRGGAWDSDGKVSVPTATDDITWLILSPSAEFSGEVDAAMRECLKYIRLQDPAITGEVVQNIIRTLAVCHPDINDHMWMEVISACPVVSMNANNITTGTMSASKVLFGDGTALTTASRVINTRKWGSGSAVTLSGTMQALAGYSFSVTAQSANDVFNLQFVVQATLAAGASTGSMLLFAIVDGNTSSPADSQTFNFAVPATAASTNVTASGFLTVTGLSAATHTISIYASANGSMSANPASGSVLLQRIY